MSVYWDPGDRTPEYRYAKHLQPSTAKYNPNPDGAAQNTMLIKCLDIKLPRIHPDPPLTLPDEVHSKVHHQMFHMFTWMYGDPYRFPEEHGGNRGKSTAFSIPTLDHE